jgi:ubiquitin-like protein Pup
MAEQEQKRKSPSREGTKTKTEADDELAAEQAPASSERGEKIKAELDDLLDEIDEVLEDNAEEFVRNYVQKGGQ